MKKNIILVILLIVSIVVFPLLIKCAEITFTISDPNKVTRVLDGVCGAYRYDPNTDGTQVQFLKARTKQFWKETTLAWEYDQAKNAIVPEDISLDEE